MKPIFSSAASLLLAGFLTLLAAAPAHAGGVVTDCTTFGPGPGTLAAAVETDGLVTFSCSGTITLTEEIPLPLPGHHLAVDGSGQQVILSGGKLNRLFNVGPKSSLQLHNITLINGNAGSNGGGAISTAGVLTITNSAILSSTAAYGGALEVMNGSVFIQNSTIAYNQALDPGPDSGGGAIDMYFTAGGSDPSATPYEVPSVILQNSTVVGNRSARADRDGIWQENGQLRLRQSILAYNGTRNCKIDAPYVNQQFFSTGVLDTDGNCRPAVQADPALQPLGFHGARAPLFALAANSPAIDAAPTAACAGTTDQRGALRPRDGNRDGAAGCDLGAYEYGNRFMVKAANGEGLVGYWKFDEGAGSTSVDSSGSGLTARLTGGAGFTSDHPTQMFANSAALQSSPSGGVVVDDAAALNPQGELTVAAWVRLNSGAGVQPIVVKGGSGQGYGLFVREGELSAEAWDSAGGTHVITGSLAAGSWLHIAMTYKQGGEMAAYINGRRVSGQAVTPGLSTSAAPLQMAADGAVDDVRIYNRALSAGAVAALASGRSCAAPGTTWGEAFPDLQCALADSNAGSEVWVASGVYRPTQGPNRSASFVVGDGVSVYGGFGGTETTRDQRQAATPRPVLSGDIEGNDRVDASGIITELAAIAGGNALHVVTIAGMQAPSVLERMTVTGGQANGPGGNCANACGGGIYVTGGVPQLRHLALISNHATSGGGGLYGGPSSGLIVASSFRGNQAGEGGGAFLQDGRYQVVNTLFSGNFAGGNGGGLHAVNTPVRMVNVTAAGNRAGGSGGGLVLSSGSSLNNTVLGGNTAGSAAGNALDSNAQISGNGVTVQNSLVQNGCGQGVNCSSAVLFGDPQFAQLADPALAPNSLGDYRLQPQSAAIDRGVNDAGFDPSLPEGATIQAIVADLAEGPRIVAALALPPRIDLGAYEAPNSPPVFMTPAATQAGINAPYVYDAVAEDPNHPGVRLAVEVVVKPQWLAFGMQASGAGRLQGTPGEKEFGSYNIILRATDSLGAVGDQSFMLKVKFRLNPVFLPAVLNQR